MAHRLLDLVVAYCALCPGAPIPGKGAKPVMKTAVGLMATTMITAALASGASAEWRLYVNRDNKAWSLERAYATNDDCDRAARILYRSGQALGVGCAEYPAPGSVQAPTPRSAEFSRSTSSIERQVARGYETPRASASRAPRVAEYPARPAPRSSSVAEAPAAVIFPPSGGYEVRRSEPARPAVVAQAAPAPRRQAGPKTPQPNPVAQPSADDEKSSAAVMLAKAATEASAATEREAADEAAKREAAVVADRAERRTTLAVSGAVMLVILTGVAYSVYRVARTSPLRGMAVGLMELGALAIVLAYPVAELWTRLRISESIVLSFMPGVLAGIVIAGVGVIVLALDLTRNPSRSKAPAGPRDAERKPQAPVELIKPGEYIKAGEPSKPGEPVRPVEPAEAARPAQPIRFEPVSFLDAPRAEAPKALEGGRPKWAAVKAPEAPAAVDAVKAIEPAKPVEPAKRPEPAKPVEAPRPAEPPKWAAVKAAETQNLEPTKAVDVPKVAEPPRWVAVPASEPSTAVEPAVTPVEVDNPVEVTKPLEPAKPLQLVTPLDVAKQIEPAKPAEPEKGADAPAPVAGGS